MLERCLVVVTGGARGIGRVVAHALAQAGAKVVITGRDRQTLAQAAQELGDNVSTLAFDVSDAQSVQHAFSEIETRYGPIDILVNNAGVWGPVEYFWQSDIHAWSEAIDINFKGTALCTHAALNSMVPRRRGKIINIVSNAGVFRWPTCSSYSSSKAAVIKLTENLAVEAKLHRVALYAFHPGLVHSDGMSVDTVNNPPPAGSVHRQALQWFLDEQQAGRTVDAALGADYIVKLCAGDYFALSGRYITVYDDLDVLLARRQEVRQQDLLTLRVRSLPAATQGT